MIGRVDMLFITKSTGLLSRRASRKTPNIDGRWAKFLVVIGSFRRFATTSFTIGYWIYIANLRWWLNRLDRRSIWVYWSDVDFSLFSSEKCAARLPPNHGKCASARTPPMSRLWWDAPCSMTRDILAQMRISRRWLEELFDEKGRHCLLLATIRTSRHTPIEFYQK